jgi:SPP1 gp7 family putative phage head morphogenesis protein
MFDSVFTAALTVPFESDRPLIPIADIERGLDAIENASIEQQQRILMEQTANLLEKAGVFLAARDVAGIQSLEWSASVALQAPIFSVWSMGWQLGSAHMIREMISSVPENLRKKISFSSSLRTFATAQEKDAIASLLQLQPGTIVNTAAEQAVLRRTIQLAGNFGDDQLAKLKVSLIGAISPDADGKVLSRKELLDQVQANLKVGKARAEMIARTELTNAYNSSRIQTALQSSIVTHFRFLAIGDARTTPICRSRNGMLIAASDLSAIAANKPPLHVRCRSTVSPVMGTINPTHAEWIADPARQPGNRTLEPLPKGWTTSELPKAPTPPPAPTPTPTPTKPKKAKAEAFPKSIDKLETVRSLGGSTGATLVRDPKTGKQFVLKRGSSAEHLREEFAADQAYQALGVSVPKAKLYETATGPAKLAEFVEGRSLKAVLAEGGEAAAKAIAQLEKNFAADALLGNWDVVGLDLDNVLVDKGGQVWRIDNGGSLRYRAQGALKGNAWNKYPTELFSLRDAAVNVQTSEVFGGLKHFDVVEQMRSLGEKEAALLKALPKELHETIKGRLFEMRRQVGIADTLKADKWNEGYIGSFNRHSLGLRSSGIVERLPDQLRQKAKGGVTVVDKAGKAFDDLRGEGSHMLAVRDYIKSVGGDYNIIENWMDAQAGSSWSNDSQAFKYFIANNRSAPMDSYFWRDGVENAKQQALRVAGEAKKRTGNAATYAKSFVPWHAFQYEMMDRVDFDLRDAASKTIKLIRTENKAVMSANNFVPGTKNLTLKRGAAESTSIYKRVEVFGSEVTTQDVPYHRVFGNYFHERSPGQGGSAFLGDGENEFVTLLDDIPFDYEKTVKRKTKKKTTQELADELAELGDFTDFGDLFN